MKKVTAVMLRAGGEMILVLHSEHEKIKKGEIVKMSTIRRAVRDGYAFEVIP